MSWKEFKFKASLGYVVRIFKLNGWTGNKGFLRSPLTCQFALRSLEGQRAEAWVQSVCFTLLNAFTKAIVNIAHLRNKAKPVMSTTKAFILLKTVIPLTGFNLFQNQ